MTEQVIEKPEKKRASWDDNIRTVVIAFLLAVLFRSVAYEPFHIPSGSMKNTLLIGDYLFVSKFSYGYSRYSFPFGFPPFHGRILDSKPERGDIVVFRLPSKPRIDFIKRIIGMPGDKIQLKQGIVYINDEPLKRQPLDNYADLDATTNIVKSIPRLSETLPEGKVIHILKEYKYGPADDTPVYEVPQGYYFMMGDNRDNSHDSRYLQDVGYVPEENIVGRASLIVFSTDGTASLNPVTWFTSLRTERFFKRIE
jgi:signal peptidase I